MPEEQTLPPRPKPPPAPRPHVDCEKVKHAAGALINEGHPEIAQFLLRVTGCSQ